MPLSPFALLDRLVAPAPEASRIAFLAAQPFAHRGLHGRGIVENSRAAFSAAIALGHGIELDVQAAMGGEALVFHDETLDRLTNEHGDFSGRSAEELEKTPLAGSNETIPRLTEILALVAGRAPVLIEVKAPGALVGQLCLSVRRALEGYGGQAAIMSFNPNVGNWFLTHAPRIVRGLVVTEEGQSSRTERLKGGVKRLFSLWRAKPDFLAYDIRDLPSAFAGRQRARGLKLLTWTVRTSAQERTAFAYADEAIYEKPPVISG